MASDLRAVPSRQNGNSIDQEDAEALTSLSGPLPSANGAKQHTLDGDRKWSELKVREGQVEKPHGHRMGEGQQGARHNGKATSLYIRSGQQRGFLIPVQSLLPAQSPAQSSSQSGRPSSSDSHVLDQQPTSSLVRGAVGTDGATRLQTKSRLPEATSACPTSLARSRSSQASEQARIVTPSALSAPPASPSPWMAQSKPDKAHAPAKRVEGKRRRVKPGMPTTRVTRSATKKDQDGGSSVPQAQHRRSEPSFRRGMLDGAASPGAPQLHASFSLPDCLTSGRMAEHSGGQPAQQVRILSLPSLSIQRYSKGSC